jgi:hypothetical protein
MILAMGNGKNAARSIHEYLMTNSRHMIQRSQALFQIDNQLLFFTFSSEPSLVPLTIQVIIAIRVVENPPPSYQEKAANDRHRSRQNYFADHSCRN